ncbi:hypothetical protein ABH931_002827 [Streptacidiphilus sp. MAP12-33]|uniref:Wzz/FepE/Etk N-terminal domain-containing protein n=1 Tax=Streptacidiphilus sp. MAP12-33 TaxID=3156266 RepID=UPI003511043B
MDLAEIARVMRRRWYVLLPGLLLTAALAVAIIVVLPPKYQSQSTVELLNSQKATVPFDGNPFLSTQTSLTGMADSLGRNLNSDSAKAELAARGVSDTYVAMIADNAQAPLMWLTVTGPDPSQVLAEDRTLTAYAAERLQQFQTQQSVPQDAMIRMMTIVSPQTPAAQTKTRIEYTVLAGLLGLALSLVATFFVEARRRRAPDGADSALASPDAPAAPPLGAMSGLPRQSGPTSRPDPAAEPQGGRPAQTEAETWPNPAEPRGADTAGLTPQAEADSEADSEASRRSRQAAEGGRPPQTETETEAPGRPGPAAEPIGAAAAVPTRAEAGLESPTMQLAALPTNAAAPAKQRSSWFG